MFPKLKQNTVVLIQGYIKSNNDMFVPNDVTQIIILFHGYGFDIFDENGDNIFQNCDTFYINSESYFFIKNNIIYVSGSNSFGQIGFNENISRITLDKPKRFNSFKYDEISFISQGMSNDHVFIYTKDKKLYGFGRNDSIQLGIKMNVGNIQSIIDYPFKSRLKQVKCGWIFSIFLTVNGNVYGCGSISLNNITITDDNFTIKSDPNSCIDLIIPNYDIQYIDCCSETGYALSKNGRLIGFGSNTLGQLGNNNNGKVHAVFISNITQSFSCGYSHVGILTKNNNIYMFGCNSHYECGYSDYDHSIEFDYGNLIELDTAIVSVKCGDWHTIIKTDNNDYYSFGSNKFNQLLINSDKIYADDDDKKEYKPQLISLQYLKKLTHSNMKILDIIPVYEKTLIIQSV